MAVTLNPETRYRNALDLYVREANTSPEALAVHMGVLPGMMTSYLNAEIVPDPEMFLRLREALNVPWHDKRGLDHDYVRLLARAQAKSRKRTSKIQKRHVVPTGMPDPLTAESAEELVEKLREVRLWALRPSYRELEMRSGRALKRSTLCDMLNPRNTVLPRVDRYVWFLEACGVQDLTYWITAWRRLAPPDAQRQHLQAEIMQAQLRADAR